MFSTIFALAFAENAATASIGERLASFLALQFLTNEVAFFDVCGPSTRTAHI